MYPVCTEAEPGTAFRGIFTEPDAHAPVSGESRDGMRIVMGSDHAGFGLKEQIKQFVREQGHEVQDCGTHDDAAVDYPDYA